MERGHIQGLPNCFGCPLLSQERVELQTSNFVHIVSIRRKAHEILLDKQPWAYLGNPEHFQGTSARPATGAHCVFIFVIAQLSCRCITSVWRYISGDFRS